jgi:hypothetical protein
LEDAVLYGRARNLDVTLLAGRACTAAHRPAEIFKRIIDRRRKADAADSSWGQARQAREEWRRERYSRLIAR